MAAESGAVAHIRFTYQNPQTDPAKYVLLLDENGAGSYQSQSGTAAPDSPVPSAQPLDREIRVSNRVLQKILAAARSAQSFKIPCEAAGAKVAYQGTKTLEYWSAGDHGSCSYNYTTNHNIQYLTRTFEGISLTIEEGPKLAVEYGHSRLSLDSELETLADLAGRGEALELENIAPILKKIADDDTVIDRDRQLARSLLGAAN